MKSKFGSKLIRPGAWLIAVCLLAGSLAIHAQNTFLIVSGSGAPAGTNAAFASGGGFGISINGSDIGTILLQACDLDNDGKASLTELKNVAATYFAAWDTNSDGSLSAGELSAALKQLFPQPPAGSGQAVCMVNGVVVQVPPDQIPTPDKQVVKHLMALADANKDGVLTLDELDAFLDHNFSHWDQNGDRLLDAQELGMAFGQLARPD